MDILVALKQEQSKLQQQLKGIQGAIAALNGAHHAPRRAQPVSHKGVRRKRTMSAAGEREDFKVNKRAVGKVQGSKG